MTPDEPPRAELTEGGPLFEFVDEAHEVTEEERNRPRYGRPVRNKPEASQPEPPKPEAPAGGPN